MRKRMQIMIAIVALAPALSAQSSPPREPVARIGDQAIYDDDRLPSIVGNYGNSRIRNTIRRPKRS
jgi:hypothetical protein